MRPHHRATRPTVQVTPGLAFAAKPRRQSGPRVLRDRQVGISRHIVDVVINPIGHAAGVGGIGRGQQTRPRVALAGDDLETFQTAYASNRPRRPGQCRGSWRSRGAGLTAGA
jgi:hypothetical protein